MSLAANAAEILTERYLKKPLTQVPSGTLFRIYEKMSDESLAARESLLNKNIYVSTYWKNMPNGVYEIYMSQGGFRGNKEIPIDEKASLKKYLKPILQKCFENGFSGWISLANYGGHIVEITINSK